MTLTIRQRRLLKQSITYVLVISAIVVLMFPIWWGIFSSIKPSQAVFAWPPVFIPSEITLSHYRELLESTAFVNYFKNSTIVAILTMIMTLLVTIPAAYSISRYDFRGRKYLVNLSTFIYMFPYVFIGIPFFIIFARVNLVNTLPGLAVAHTATALPIALMFLYVFFADIPEEMEESARVAGASRTAIVTKILGPLALPGVVATMIYVWVHSWIEYFFALVILNSSDLYTLPLGIAGLINIATVNWGMVMAGVIAMSLPSILVIFYLQKHLLRGFAVAH